MELSEPMPAAIGPSKEIWSNPLSCSMVRAARRMVNWQVFRRRHSSSLRMTGDDDTSRGRLSRCGFYHCRWILYGGYLAGQSTSQQYLFNTKLLIVGDADQLPSVSPGQVLSDLSSPNHSSSQTGSHLPSNEDWKPSSLASQIIKATCLQISEEKTWSFLLWRAPAHRSHDWKNHQRCRAAFRPETSGPRSDVSRFCGDDQINSLMQELLNPLETDALFFQALDCSIEMVESSTWSMMPESNVSNGDIGYITDLLPAKYTESKQELTIRIWWRSGLPAMRWYKIRLAMLSIPQVTGSGNFLWSFCPWPNQSRRMLQRNLTTYHPLQQAPPGRIHCIWLCDKEYRKLENLSDWAFFGWGSST